ncbi:hypothetical protein Q7P37_009264 [Cladosporium fusiforme]
MPNGLPTPPDSAGTSASGAPTITTWLIDTRGIWNGDNIFAAQGAAKALALVSTAEQTIITSKMFIADARMSLASALLKRLFISKTLNIPWKEVNIGRKGDAKHGKPCAVDSEGVPLDGIDFNISHQNGLVALIGFDGRNHGEPHTFNNPLGYPSSATGVSEDVTVGVDIVCVNERDDYRTIEEEGLDGWVDIYDIIFSDEERWSMKYDVDYVTMLDGTHLTADDLGRHDRCIARNKSLLFRTPSGNQVSLNSEQLIEAKLRRFYTFFCYKEAFIKLSGEALLAPWIKALEFFNVRSPKPGVQPRCSNYGVWGEEVDDVEVHLHKKEVGDVKMKIQAFEEDFMISTAMQGDIEGLKVPGFTTLDMESDVMNYAEGRLYKQH